MRRIRDHVSIFLAFVFLLICVCGCTKQFQSYQIYLEVPADLQRAEISIPDNDRDKLEFTSEENLSVFTQFAEIELKTVPYKEVARYQNETAGVYTYNIELFDDTSCVSYEFSLPYLKLPNGDWCKIADEQKGYDLSTTLLSLAADNPEGVTIWELIFTLN